MHPNDTIDPNYDKSHGSSTVDKSGVVVVAVPGHGGMQLDAEHVIDVKTGRKQLIYLGPKSDGIDFIVTERTVTARSERAKELLDAHTGGGTDDGEKADTDGHADMCDRCSGELTRPDRPDSAGLCGPCYHLACPGCDTGHVGGREGNPRCTEECGFFTDDEPELVTDGGRSIAQEHPRDPRDPFGELPYEYDAGKAGMTVTDLTGDVTREGVLFDASDELDAPEQYNPRSVHQGLKYQNGEYRTLNCETIFARCAATGDVFITGVRRVRELPSACPVCGAVNGGEV